MTLLLGGALCCSSARAQIELDRFFPPVVGGGEVTIQAEGKFPLWPCEVRCDRSDVELSPAKDAGQFVAKVAENAPPGVAWVRLIDKDSVSDLVPLLVAPVATTLESAASEGSALSLPAVVAGRLARSGEVDSYRVSLKAGDTLVANVTANRVLQSPMDAVLQLADARGNVLFQSDDGRGLDPQLMYQASEDIEASIRIFAFPSTPNSTVGFAGGSAFVYSIEVTTGPYLDHVLPIVTGAPVDAVRPSGWNLPDQPALRHQLAGSLSPATWSLDQGLGWHWQGILIEEAANLAAIDDSILKADSLPVVFTGTIGQPKQIDRLRFAVMAGKRYRAKSISRSAGFLTDPVLRIVDPETGAEIARKDDNSRSDFEAIVDFKAKEDDEYELQVSDAVEAFGKRHVYGVSLDEVVPSVRLTVASDHFRLDAGATLEIPVTISRMDGYAEQVRLAITGLPEGVTASEAVSGAKGGSAKSVKLNVSAGDGAVFQDTIRIVATVDDEDKQPTDATHPVVYQLRDTVDVTDLWLTVAPKE